ncbi:MAG: hypothetical protein FWG55_00950 [Candidatus Bathyarchaeota archaeon]|jgi:uncharacterized protein YwgA|nr:hypothetical protein [Candidatus Termiticorpusculum sp.]MDR2707676.1 hypothetical protein [Nitrososphaerota archaeon]
MSQQQIKDKIINRFLTLYLIDNSFKKKQLRFLSETKLQKLVFLSELDMLNKGIEGFNFYFLRLHYGPYSFELAKDKAQLITSGFLEEKALKPTKDATYLMEDFSTIIARNAKVISEIDSVNCSYAPLELDFLLNKVHSMPWKNATVHDLPQRTPMLYPLKPSARKIAFDISDKELDDLVMNLDPDVCQEFDEAENDVNEGRFLTHEQVFSNV